MGVVPLRPKPLPSPQCTSTGRLFRKGVGLKIQEFRMIRLPSILNPEPKIPISSFEEAIASTLVVKAQGWIEGLGNRV